MINILKETDSFFPHQNFFTQVLSKHTTQKHSHEYYEIFYVLSGKATHIVNDEHTELKQYELVLIKPYQTHLFTFEENTNFYHRDLLIRKKFFENILLLCPP